MRQAIRWRTKVEREKTVYGGQNQRNVYYAETLFSSRKKLIVEISRLNRKLHGA